MTNPLEEAVKHLSNEIVEAHGRGDVKVLLRLASVSKHTMNLAGPALEMAKALKLGTARLMALIDIFPTVRGVSFKESPALLDEVRHLLQNIRVDPDVRYNFGWSLLMRAASFKKERIVDLLIEAGADVNFMLRDGYSALDMATSPRVLQALLQAGAHLNERSLWGACGTEDAEELVILMLNAGANPNWSTSEGGVTPLMMAASHSPQICRLLIDAGANVDAQDNIGWTALMYAAREGELPTVEVLLTAGAEIDACNDDGETALEIAWSEEHEDVVDRLRMHPAQH